MNSQIEVPENVPFHVTDRRFVTGRPIYQIVLLVLTAVIVFGAHVYVAIDRQPRLDDWGSILAVEVVILLLVYPAIQFAAAMMAIIGAAIFAKPQLKGLYFRSLLRILAGMVAGFGVGLAAMAAALGAMYLAK